MFRSLTLSLLAPLFAGAAPVPKNETKAKIESKFGKIVDPKGDSKFELDGEALKITLPAGVVRGFGATYTDVKLPNGRRGSDITYHNDVPRVEFEWDGDFVLTVRVHTPLSDDAKSAKDAKEDPHTVGGVLVLKKDGSWERVAALRERDDEKGIQTTFLNDNSDLGAFRNIMIGYTSKKLKGDTAWIRMTRTRKNQRCELSDDGQKWDYFGDDFDAFPDGTVTVALYAQHGSDKAHTVTFDQFSIEKPKAEKK